MSGAASRAFREVDRKAGSLAVRRSTDGSGARKSLTRWLFATSRSARIRPEVAPSGTGNASAAFLDFTDAALVFAGVTLEVEGTRKNYGESRIICYGL